MKRALCLALALVLILLSACATASPTHSGQNMRPIYESYKEIPGVTQEDIEALEELLAIRPRLVYGFIVTSESFLREDGSVGGFAPLLCDRMSELFGFEFDLHPYSWEELVNKTLAKEIDLIADLTPTPERMQQYLMTDAIAQRTFKIFTHKDAPDLNETADKRPLRCATLDGSTTHQRIAESWSLPFESVFIENEETVPDMLLSGEIDTFIEEGVIEASFDAHNFIEAKEYYPLTYSPISLTTGNSELKPIIDIMQKYLKNGGYYELTERYNQGYKDYLRNKLLGQLTEEEKEYILHHSTEETAVSLACESSNYPSSFFNYKEKKFQGIAIDILDQISDLTDLKFKPENRSDASWSDLLEGLENGKYDIITALYKTANRENRFLWAQEPYCMDNYALLSRTDQPDVDINQILFRKVGLIEDIAYTDVFLEWFPFSENTITYKESLI